MLREIKTNIIVTIRNFTTLFWSLVFSIILGTLMFLSFGNIKTADFETVPVAVVENSGDHQVFKEVLKQLEDSEEHLINVTLLTKEEAESQLKAKTVSGIYYLDDEISLAVGGSGLSESILQTVLENYENSKAVLENVMTTHPESMEAAVLAMSENQNLVEDVSLGGKTIDTNVQYFYALIAMTCMYGAFSGLSLVTASKANLSPLGARRSITPTNKISIVIAQLISAVSVHFVNVVILFLYLSCVLKIEFSGNVGLMLLVALLGSVIGVSIGILVGSIGKMGEGSKVGIIVGTSMVCSFLAGLMYAGMKDVIEKTVPLVNRINPAAVITDAFYCINVYNDPQRLAQSLLILAAFSIILLGGSFCVIRRERYDSI